jgi:voltage-gated potassium channel
VEPSSEPRSFGILRLPDESLTRSIVRRILLALTLLMAVTLILWLDRDGLRDNAHPGEPISLADVFYFTVVSLATVGYGDIAPVSDGARFINSVLLTPVRIFVWVLFLGTAYELTVARMRLREGYRMRQLRERLDQHVIVCGYGVKGRAIVDEMLAHGFPRDDIVIIDPVDAAVAAATEAGLVALHGDASSSAMLRAAAVEKAGYVMVAPNRDDACVLICLTVRSLAPDAQVIASAREEENIRLIYGAGADMVVAPSVSGGRLMASAVQQKAVALVLQDLLSVEHGLGVAERIVQPKEAGLLPSELPDISDKVLLGGMRGKQRFSYRQLATLRLEPQDALVYLTSDD